tara:strand:+ start:317 stop:619 length:303 start_codon:yes stop_codon:yes gene_type:complete
MIVKFIEIYEATKAHTKIDQRNFSLREVFINPEHVVCVRSEPGFKRKLLEGVLPEDLDNRQEFSRVYMNRGQAGLDVIVVGDPTIVEEKLNVKRKKLLKG